jgi:hypothetical protein
VAREGLVCQGGLGKVLASITCMDSMRLILNMGNAAISLLISFITALIRRLFKD